MSGRYKQPVGQKRLTNVAVVRYKKHGKRFEIACYKNKVISWRNKVEKDLDEVLQSKTVYQNVSKGVLAKSKDLMQAFATDDQEKICLEILEHGELQVSDKEREAAHSNQLRDIATIVMDKTVNPETERPYPIGMIERFMREMHFAVDPHHSSKQQALELIRELQKKFPITRAQMKLRLTVPTSAAPELRETLLGGWGSKIEKEEHATSSGQVSLIFRVDPGRFRECDAMAKDNKGRLEVVSMSVQKEGDLSVDIYDEDTGERGLPHSSGRDSAPTASDSSAGCVIVNKFSEALVIGGRAWEGDQGKKAGPLPSSDVGAGGASLGPRDSSGAAAEGRGPTTTGRTSGTSGVKVQRCNTCDAEFSDTKEHREHFKSSWHKHNLKRKMKGLPPLSAEECEADTEIQDTLNDMHNYSR